MKSIELASKKISSTVGASFLQNTAKSILFSRLAQINRGLLVVEDEGETFTFGKAESEHDLRAHIKIHNPATYARILFAGATGSGEAYMAKHWSSPDLLAVIRLFLMNKSQLGNMNTSWANLSKMLGIVHEFFRINTLRGSKKNISAHYDLSNEFFALFLDESMMYSSAIFPRSDMTLEQAAEFKLDHVCRRLQLNADDHLLEIGTGWGGMAMYAARHYGCRVTTTTISQQQFAHAKAQVEAQGLSDRVRVLKQDYRELEGQYDKLVSIEMVEAVGHQYYREFFSRCSRLLKNDGLMLIQAITTQDQRYEAEKNESDFIRKHIFPGGCLPCNTVITEKVARFTDMHLVGLEDITLDYARTLAQWRQRFFTKLDQVKKLGFDEVFIRMWEFYLCYCEGGFSERVINTSQFLFAKPQARKLPVVG